ncbi:MAG: beta-hydroxyacyl-ACP dehydratase [Planctomycetota bacterium]|jgi:3-hydroxyacyl-[acyl-carrier-protein] dehydratase
MRYRQLDKIIELIPGERIVAQRTLQHGEDYLRDHFPLFPVMPGVMMLEAMFQASCWLVRATEEFKHSIISLDEVRNVKFADFMEPGQLLTVVAEIVKSEDRSVTLKASGNRGDVVAVSGRLVLGKKNLEMGDPELAALDEFSRDAMRQEFAKLMHAE